MFSRIRKFVALQMMSVMWLLGSARTHLELIRTMDDMSCSYRVLKSRGWTDSDILDHWKNWKNAGRMD